MRLLVTGGRTYGVAKPDDSPERHAEAAAGRATLTRALDAFHARHTVTLLIHGAAMGADSWAWQWATGRCIPALPFPADWRRLGRRAGPIRNARMLCEGHPDAVLAFPGGAGTADMVGKAQAAGVPMWVVRAGRIERLRASQDTQATPTARP